MAGCICCKFNNCRHEFEKHRNHTTFSSLDRWFSELAKFSDAVLNGNTEIIKKYVGAMCVTHTPSEVTTSWVMEAWAYFDTLKKGVLLPKIKVRP